MRITGKLLGLLVFLALPGLAMAQGSRYDSQAMRTLQNFLAPIPGASITVCSASGTGTPCSPLVPTSPVTLCTDSTCSTAAPNPFLADSNGNFGFWAQASATYKVSITAPGVTGQLLTVVMPIVGGGAGTFTTLTASGNMTATAGQNTFGGYKFNAKIFVENNKFTTPESAIATCPASPTGCSLYHEDFASTSAGFTLGGSPAVNYFGQRMTLGSAARINLNGKISLLDSSELIGSDTLTSLLIPGGSFPNSTPMIDVGDNSNAINASTEYLRINANVQTGLTGVRARGTNDSTRFLHNNIVNYLTNCFLFDGTTVNTGLNLLLNNFCAAGSGATGDGISLVNTKNQAIIKTSTVSNAAQSVSAAGIHFSGTTANGYFHVVIDHHSENYSDALNVDGNQSVVGIAIDGGGSPVTTNTVHIPNTAGGVFVGIGLHNNNTASSVVKNDVTGTTISANNPPAPFGDIPLYWWMRTASDEGWIDFSGFHIRSTTGGLVLHGATSGTVTHVVPATITSYTETDPSAAPTVANAVKQYTTGGVASFSGSPGTLTIASGTATMTTAAIAAGACGTTVTVAATNVLTTDTITVAFNAAPAGTNAGLTSWPTAGNVNFAYCPGVAETPAAATINWRVVR